MHYHLALHTVRLQLAFRCNYFCNCQCVEALFCMPFWLSGFSQNLGLQPSLALQVCSTTLAVNGHTGL